MGVYYETGNRRRRKAYGSQGVPGTGTEHQHTDRQQAGAGIVFAAAGYQGVIDTQPGAAKRDTQSAPSGRNHRPYARERVVLELRYLAFKDWASIADTLGLHIRQVYRLHDEALKHIEIPGECH